MKVEREFLKELYRNRIFIIPYLHLFQNNKELRNLLFQEYLDTNPVPDLDLYINSFYSKEEIEAGLREARKRIPANQTGIAGFFQQTDFEIAYEELQNEFYRLSANHKVPDKFKNHSIENTVIIEKIKNEKIKDKIQDFNYYVVRNKDFNVKEYAEAFAKNLINTLPKLNNNLLSKLILEDFIDYQNQIEQEYDFRFNNNHERDKAKRKYRELTMYANNIISDYLNNSKVNKSKKELSSKASFLKGYSENLNEKSIEMNYLEIVLQGYFNENNREFLEKYFFREFKKAEKEHFFEADEFFKGCLKVIEGWEKHLQAKVLERKQELYLILNGAKNGTMQYTDLQGKTVEEKKQETIRYCEQELTYIRPDQIGSVSFTVNLHTLTNGRIAYNMSYLEVLKIRTYITKAFVRATTPNKTLEHQRNEITTNKLEKCLHLLSYWLNEDITVINKLLDNNSNFDKNYFDPYSKELNKNLLIKDTFEAKTDVIRYYIFEFWELQGFFTNHKNTLYHEPNNDGSIICKNINEVKTDFEKYTILCFQYFDIMFNEIQRCCIKYNIDFFKICSELGFSTEFFDSSISLVFNELQSKNLKSPQAEKQKPKPKGKERLAKIEKLKSIWLAEPKLTVEDFIQAGNDKGFWNDNLELTLQRNVSSYGTGKTFLGNVFIAFKGWAIPTHLDYKEAGRIFCEVFNINIKESTKEKYKAFSSGNGKQVAEVKRTFTIK